MKEGSSARPALWGEPEHLQAGLASVAAFREMVGRYREVGVTDVVVHWPRPAEPFAGSLATFERIVSAQAGTA